MKRTNASAKQQRGAFLLEALIGILIFSMGILAMVGLQTLAVKASAEAKYRGDASYLANQMIGRMWATAPRDPATGNLLLVNYAHNGAANACEGASAGPGTGDAVKAAVQQWLDNIGNALPNATEQRQQISIGADNLVTVSVCWQAPGAPVRNVVVTSQLRAD
ncbi:MAG: type IV pilus modification protein PilV [Pseudomonadota bacterium]